MYLKKTYVWEKTCLNTLYTNTAIDDDNNNNNTY